MNNKSEKYIIVTGASGLVGQSILDKLKGNNEYRVTGIYQTHQPLIAADNINYLKGDLTNKEVWDQLQHIPADVLIHSAATIPSSFTVENQEQARRNNLAMDKYAVSYALEKTCTLTYLSSAGIYGFKIDKIRDENSAPDITGAYFSGKWETENTLSALKDRLRSFILRITAPYGPHQRNSTVMTIFIENALAAKPLRYYGTGSRTQDFVYVGDVARACLQTVGSENYGVYNIASGRPVSMKTLAHTIKKLTGSKSDVLPDNVPDPQEDFRALFDITKAKTFLNWRPQYDLEQGVLEYIGHLERERS